MERKILPSYCRVGSMEAYGSGSQVLQGQPVYQVVRKPNVLPQVQQSVQSNASLPSMVSSGYQYPHASNVVNYSGLNRPVEMTSMKTTNQANYVVQSVDNANKVLFWIHNPVSTNNSSNLHHGQGNDQGDKLHNLQMAEQGMRNVPIPNIPKSGAQKITGNPIPANPQDKSFIKIPEPTHVNLNTYVSEKVGSLKIHISESFLPWSITNKTILDLDFMRHLFNISGIDVILNDKKRYHEGLKVAMMQLLQSKILADWLVLKCEEKEIPFLKVNSQVEIYTTSNFTALLNVVSQETCLPLPFFIEEDDFVKYMYLNFPKTGNDKVKKLNAPIFHVPDIGKKKLPCKYPGIRMDCEFENAAERFVIYVHESALRAYETFSNEIRQYIIYKHIIWGFLQMWIRLVKKEYNECFKFEDIAKNLCLCRAEVSQDKSRGMETGLIYNIGYMNCYLKFDPVTLKESKASFLLNNFSPKIVCNLPIVQYYKQYFLISDMRYSDALRNTVIFFRNCYYKNVKPGSYADVPTGRPVAVQPNKNYVPQVQPNSLLKNTSNTKTSANLPASTSAVKASCTSEVHTNKNEVVRAESGQTSDKPVLAKPLLKTRTVEEINSMVDLIKETALNTITEASNVCEITYSEGKDKSRRLNYRSFVSLILKFLENCYAANTSELSAIDESNEEEMIEQRFDEAVRIAVGAETVESFIEKIYVHLQLHYTNLTCQNILNKRIWKAIEAKYHHLKEYVSENIAKSLKKKSLTCDTNLQNKNTSLSSSELNDQMNVFGHGVKSGNVENSDVTTVSVTLESETTTSDSEVDTHCSQENNKAGNALLREEREIGSRSESMPDVSPRKVSQQESHVTSTNERNICDSASPAYESHSKKNKKHTKKRQDKQSRPYTNTLTFVRVSSNPATFRISKKSRKSSVTQSSYVEKNQSCDTPKKISTVTPMGICNTPKTTSTVVPVGICNTSKTTPAITSKESCNTPKKISTVASKGSYTTPKTTPTVTPMGICNTPKTTSTVVPVGICNTPKTTPAIASKGSYTTPKTTPAIASKGSYTTPKTTPAIASKGSCNTSKTISTVTSNETYDTPKALPTVTSKEILDTDQTPAEEREQYVHTVEKDVEVHKEYPEQNVKSCSVVLNPKDVEVYMKRCRKRKRKESLLEESDTELDHDYLPKGIRRKLYEEDSDDDDFLAEKKRLRRKVSEMQYMEARTRVLQRLRKRKSLYAGYEGTRISGEELDSFFVGSSLPKSSNHEDSEKVNQDGYETEKENDSEIDQDQSNVVTANAEKESAIKDLRVVLVRLEDTPEYEKYMDKALPKTRYFELLRKIGMDYLNTEHFPQVDKKYFEKRDGVLYLRDEYYVKDGAILRKDEADIPVQPKIEPESPIHETDFNLDIVKTEPIAD